MPQPNKIPKAFAASGDRNIIPESTGDLGLASWNEGFPAICSVPFSEGGLAPKRADFNGVFNALSAATVWAQQGGVYAYDNVTDYEIGNLVIYNNALFYCLAANGPSSAVKAPTNTSVWGKVITATGGKMTGDLYLPQSYFAISVPSDAGVTVTAGEGRNYISGNFLQIAQAFTVSDVPANGWYKILTADLSTQTDLTFGEIYVATIEHISSASAVGHRDRILHFSLASGVLTIRGYFYSGDSSINLRPCVTMVARA